MYEIYLFHGKGGSPSGSVSVLEKQLRLNFSDSKFTRPLLLHHDPNVLAEDSLATLRELEIPQSAIVIGISLGGLIAARFQETDRADLKVICVSSPTWADGVRVERMMPRRAAFYSSNDEVIFGRTAEWPSLARAFDIPRLTHDTDQHAELLARGISAYLEGDDVNAALREKN
jgi:pimeloyl-ACP methyl ester carboxylesterase